MVWVGVLCGRLVLLVPFKKVCRCCCGCDAWRGQGVDKLWGVDWFFLGLFFEELRVCGRSFLFAFWTLVWKGRKRQPGSLDEFLSVRRTMDNVWQVCQGYWMGASLRVVVCGKLRAFQRFFCTGQGLQFFWDSAVLHRKPFDRLSEATTLTIRHIQHTPPKHEPTKGSNQKSRVPPVLS